MGELEAHPQWRRRLKISDRDQEENGILEKEDEQTAYAKMKR